MKLRFEKHLTDMSQSDRIRQEIIANDINSLFQRAIRTRGKVAQRRNKINVKSSLPVEIDCVLCPPTSIITVCVMNEYLSSVFGVVIGNTI